MRPRRRRRPAGAPASGSWSTKLHRRAGRGEPHRSRRSSGQAPSGAVGRRCTRSSPSTTSSTTRAGHGVALALVVAHDARQPTERARHGHQAGVVHPPRLHPHLGSPAVACQAVGPVPAAAHAGADEGHQRRPPARRGLDLRGEVGRHAGAVLRRRRAASGCSPYNERDVTASWPELAGLPDALPATTALLDGELVATDDDGPTELRAASSSGCTSPTRPRRAARGRRCPCPTSSSTSSTSTATTSPASRCRIVGGCSTRCSSPARAGACSPLHDDGPALLAAADERGLEGVVAKRLDSRYEPGKRTRTWLKVKVRRRQEMVIGGWLPGEGNRTGRIGALLVGYHDAPGDGPAHLRRPGRHRVQGGRARSASAGAVRRPRDRRVPVRPAPAPRRDPPRAHAGCAPSWSPSSSSASGPATTACAIRATSGCATDKAGHGRHPRCVTRCTVDEPEPTRSASRCRRVHAPVVEVAVGVLARRSGPRRRRACRRLGRAVRDCVDGGRRSRSERAGSVAIAAAGSELASRCPERRHRGSTTTPPRRPAWVQGVPIATDGSLTRALLDGWHRGGAPRRVRRRRHRQGDRAGDHRRAGCTRSPVRTSDAAVASWPHRRRRSPWRVWLHRRPSSAGCSHGGAAGIAGLPLPAGEHVIVASVIVLGVRPSPARAPSRAGATGYDRGAGSSGGRGPRSMQHGAEAPTASRTPVDLRVVQVPDGDRLLRRVAPGRRHRHQGAPHAAGRDRRGHGRPARSCSPDAVQRPVEPKPPPRLAPSSSSTG